MVKVIEPISKKIDVDRFAGIITKIQQEKTRVTRPGAKAKDLPSPFNQSDLELILDAVILHYLFS